MTEGYTPKEAEALRAQGQAIVTCRFCQIRSFPKPYFRYEDISFIGASLACPQHFDEDGFGKVEIGRPV